MWRYWQDYKQCLLPDTQDTPVRFIKQVLTGEKRLLLLKHVRRFNVPHFPTVSIL